MIIQKEKFKLSVVEVIQLALAVLYVIGIFIWFPVCEVTGETPMRCHWAGEVLKAGGVVITVMAVLHIVIFDEKVKAGTDFGMIGIFILMLLIPGKIIPLCMSTEMACRSHTEPWTTAFMIAMIVIAAADMLYYWHKVSNDKHKRKQTGKKV